MNHQWQEKMYKKSECTIVIFFISAMQKIYFDLQTKSTKTKRAKIKKTAQKKKASEKQKTNNKKKHSTKQNHALPL